MNLAVNDGGFEIMMNGLPWQVALLEGTQKAHVVTNGVFEALAQITLLV